MKKTWLICGLVLLSVDGARADDLAQQVVGHWTKQGDAAQTIEFYGAGVGTDANFFHYEFPSTNQISLHHGSDSTATYTISIANGELHLVDSESIEAVYDVSGGITNACVLNLHQLKGAKALFEVDHGGEEAMSVTQLIPSYLTDLPVCSDGGIYQLNDKNHGPTCSVPGHEVE
ncbi:MAG: hypothetical protein V1929_02810 [bacterium]